MPRTGAVNPKPHAPKPNFVNPFTKNTANTPTQPFKRDYPVNPSWEIARSLPEYLPPLRAKAVPGAGPNPTTTSPPIPPVRLLVHPTPIRVNYTSVRALVPQLWDTTTTTDPTNPTNPEPPQQQKIDLAIHIGMAGPRLFYSIERRGHRDGYVMQDVDGEFLGDAERRAREGEDWVWSGVPGELESALDVEDVLGRWRGYSPVSFFFLSSSSSLLFLVAADFFLSGCMGLFKMGWVVRLWLSGTLPLGGWC